MFKQRSAAKHGAPRWTFEQKATKVGVLSRRKSGSSGKRREDLCGR